MAQAARRRPTEQASRAEVDPQLHRDAERDLHLRRAEASAVGDANPCAASIFPRRGTDEVRFLDPEELRRCSRAGGVGLDAPLDRRST